MNEEKQNRNYYQETFREVHAPLDLAERLMKMDEMKKQKKAGNIIKGLAVAAVAVVVLFAGSNGIAHAMTGTTWVETMIGKLKLKDVEYDLELEKHQNEAGEVWYSGTVQEKNGDVSKYEIKYSGDLIYESISTSSSARLCFREERIYIEDGDIIIDVKEEVDEKGMATGTYQINGYTKEYKVWKEGDHYAHEVKTIYEGMEDEGNELSKGQMKKFHAGTPTPVPQE